MKIREGSLILLIASNAAHVRMFLEVAKFLPKSVIPKLVPLSRHKEGISFFIRRYGCSVVVVGNDSGPLERSIVFTAHKLGIPTLLVQDGLISEPRPAPKQSLLRLLRRLAQNGDAVLSELAQAMAIRIAVNPWRAFPDMIKELISRIIKPHLYGLSEVTLIAAIGEYYKRLFERSGVPSAKIVVTGQPRFDKIHRYKGLSKASLRESLQISSSEHIITVFTEALVENGIWSYKQFCEYLEDIVQATGTSLLLIKPHPDEDIRSLKSFQQRHLQVRVLSKNVDIYKLIHVSDVVITTRSTVGLEALLAGVPLIVYNPYPNSPILGTGPIPYLRVALRAENPIELQVALKMIFERDMEIESFRKRTSAFLTYHTHIQDGRAAERVARLILTLVNLDNRILTQSGVPSFLTPRVDSLIGFSPDNSKTHSEEL